MKNFYFKRMMFLLFLSFVFNIEMDAQTQEVIWQEDFSTPGKTGTGSPTIASWSTTVYTNNISDIRASNGTLVGYNTGNADYYGFWTVDDINPIEIDNYENVSISLEAWTNFYVDEYDLIRVQYKTDGSWAWQDFPQGTIYGKISSPLTFSVEGVTGKQLWLRILIENGRDATRRWSWSRGYYYSYDYEYHYVDNIIVTGTKRACSEPSIKNTAFILQLDDNGEGILSTEEVLSRINSQCGIQSISLSKANYNCFNLGINPLEISIIDDQNIVTVLAATVTVEDNIAPVVSSSELIVELDSNGLATINPDMVNSDILENCGIKSKTLDKSFFTCSDILVPVVVNLFVEDISGNKSQNTINITVVDKIAPTAQLKDITVELDEWGNALVLGEDFDNGSWDACAWGPLTMVVEGGGNFTCSDVGTNPVTIVINDYFGNWTKANASVKVMDSKPPTAVTMSITVQLDATGNVTITPSQLDNGSSDACGAVTLALDKTSFNCTNLGNNAVVLTVTDSNGNTATANAIVTVEDKQVSSAVAQNITVQLDATGNVTIAPSQIGSGSSDACGAVTLALDRTLFDCTNLGANSVVLTVTDSNGNIAKANATVTVEDKHVSSAVALNITVQLDATGNVTVAPSQVDNGSSDACGAVTLALDRTSFNCTNLGDNAVVLTVTDSNGNIATANATVTVEDTQVSSAIAQNITAQLDDTGNITITPSQVDNGSSDACGAVTLSIDKTSFDCNNLGDNPVVLTVTDSHGNTSTVNATVTVEDKIAPFVIPIDFILNLNAEGKGVVSPFDIDGGSLDNCGIKNWFLDKTQFTCADIGKNTVNLIVEDENENVSAATAIVTVVDNFVSSAVAQNIAVQLDATGNVTVTASQVDNGSSDACGVVTLALDKSSFNCTNLGANPVVLTVTDSNSNIATANAIVTVEDKQVSSAVAQNITVQLDATGNVTITPSQVDNGSSDACGAVTLSLDKTSFNCTNLGDNAVVLTVTDSNGNTATANAIVAVEDKQVSSAVSQNITVQLDATGNVAITPFQVDNGSSDACGAVTLALDKTSFDCTNLGANPVVLIVTDSYGNTATANAIITVEENIAPIFQVKEIQINLDTLGQATISEENIDDGSFDNCGIVEWQLSRTSFDCSDIGKITISVAITDASGNTTTGSATVVILPFQVETSVTVSPSSQQYSDEVTFIAIIKNGYCNPTQQAAEEVSFYIGTQNLGTAELQIDGIDLKGVLTTTLKEEPSYPSNGQLSPGAKLATAVFEKINNVKYEVPTASAELIIEKEIAIVEYVGQELQATASSTNSTATVLLKANIQDNSIIDAFDSHMGDIRNARVKFINRDSNTDISGWLPVQLLISDDIGTGSVSYSWTLDIGSADAQSFTVGIVVDNGYYYRNSSDDNVVLTVYKPNGDFMTGGGYLRPTASYGTFSSTENLKMNFGFNVKYNRKGTQLNGHMNIIFRRTIGDEIKIYQIKGNSMQSLGVNVNNPTSKTAEFITKSNLTDITNPEYPVSLGGNLLLKVNMTDNGEPGILDKLAVTLTDSKNSLLYSSHWNGIATEEINLSGGNLVVHSGASVKSSTTTEIKTATTSVEEDVIVQGLSFAVAPNPSDTFFAVRVISENQKDRVRLAVHSYTGSILYETSGKPSDEFTFGDRFAAGTYIVKVYQAGQTVEKVVIKM